MKKQPKHSQEYQKQFPLWKKLFNLADDNFPHDIDLEEDELEQLKRELEELEEDI